MSIRDNEIYTGLPELSPTLSRDVSANGAELYIVKPPQTTKQQDMPATSETVYVPEVPAPKKKSRAAKAMKLLTSCVTAAALTAAVAASPPPPANALPLWPSIEIFGESGWGAEPISQNSWDCQVSVGHKNYRVVALQEDIHLIWTSSFDVSHDGSSGVFTVYMEKPSDGIKVILDFDINPMERITHLDAVNQFLTTSGETYYVRCISRSDDEHSPTPEQLAANLASYIQISDETDDRGWDKVFIGETMYSETDASWNGIQPIVPDNAEGFFLPLWVCRAADLSCPQGSLICTRSVNGIDWNFYRTFSSDTPVLLAVPAQEDIVLAFSFISILYDAAAQNTETNGGEIEEPLKNKLIDFIDNHLIGTGLRHYYPAEQLPDEEPAAWTPPEPTPIPSAPTPTPMPQPTITTETIQTHYSDAVTVTSFRNAEGKLEKKQSIWQSDGKEYFDLQIMNKFERPIYRDYSIYENDQLTESRIYDLDGDRTTTDTYTYHDNGTLESHTQYIRDCIWDFGHHEFYSDELFEYFYEAYDENGVPIDNQRTVLDPSTGLYSVTNYRSAFETSDGSENGEKRIIHVTAEGLFTSIFPMANSELVEGFYCETFADTGEIWNRSQIDASGNAEFVYYHPDGSLEQLQIVTVDEGANTWTQITEFHPVPSDSSAYYTEVRVTFDSSGKVTEYYHNSDGRIADIRLDETSNAEIEYFYGKTMSFRYSGDDCDASVWFEYDPKGRLANVGSNIWHK